MTSPSGFSRPRIAIVGRPNVGKSTLFNRLLGYRQAIVSPAAGTTRDRLYGHLEWQGQTMTLLDTGGVEWSPGDALVEAVQRQVERAVAEADVLLMVCDAQEGLVPSDELLLQRLRATGKPLVVAVNKTEDRLEVAPDFFSLGVESILPVSALHGGGTGELLDVLLQRAAAASSSPLQDGSSPPALCQPARLAIVGRQNVGKSSLLNALVRDERALVGEHPGTTRDVLDTWLTFRGESVLLLDTAGLRHRRKVRSPVDVFSMARAVEALRRCDVALLVLDATQSVTRDDRRLAAQVCQIGCGLVLLVNKWDLVRGGEGRRLVETMRAVLPTVAFAPVAAVSAKTGYHVAHSLEAAVKVAQRLRLGLATWDCGPLLRRAWARRAPPRIRGRVIQLRSARWIAGRPWRLELTTRPLAALPRPYQRYLLKQLYADAHLAGIPIALTLTQSKGR